MKRNQIKFEPRRIVSEEVVRDLDNLQVEPYDKNFSGSYKEMAEYVYNDTIGNKMTWEIDVRLKRHLNIVK